MPKSIASRLRKLVRMSFTLNPLSKALGAEIIGLDLSQPLDEPTFNAVHQAHLDHLVLVFREQVLTPDQQIGFSQRFGPLDIHPADDAVLADHPEILIVSTRKENGTITWLACCAICFVGGGLGCCLIPFCVDATKDTCHACPACNRDVGKDKVL